MPNLNIPIDASLLREINYAASKAELTQRDWVVKTLAKGAQNGNVRKGRADVQEAPVPERPVQEVREDHRVARNTAPESVSASPRNSGYCPQHRKPMMDFGLKWGCDGPPFHTEMK